MATLRGRRTPISGLRAAPRRIGGARIAVHPHIPRRLKVAPHIKLDSFEKTPKGMMLHYTVSGMEKKRLLTKKEIHKINGIIKEINAHRKGKAKEVTLLNFITAVATHPETLQKVASFVLHA